ncbi:hypothetical protein NOVO_05475 [Rickettsiales bacterium Ac37b]|nr:hypothetical protein NOVO_05475 [Rickettsiales bacterium Ac37b]
MDMAEKNSINSDSLLISIKKITDYTKTSDHAIVLLTDLLENKYFRHLFAYSLNLYWQEFNSIQRDRKVFDGQEETKRMLNHFKAKVSKNAPTELGRLIRYMNLLYKTEKTLNEKEATSSATSYRESAYMLADLTMALIDRSSRQITVNTLLQAGIYFQRAANAKDIPPEEQMADEQLALEMYLTAIYISSYTTPNVELYTLIQSLKAIASFKFKNESLSEMIPHLQAKCLKIADIYPLFELPQSNISFFQDGTDSLILMRKFLHHKIKDIQEKSFNSEKFILYIENEKLLKLKTLFEDLLNYRPDLVALIGLIEDYEEIIKNKPDFLEANPALKEFLLINLYNIGIDQPKISQNKNLTELIEYIKSDLIEYEQIVKNRQDILKEQPTLKESLLSKFHNIGINKPKLLPNKNLIGLVEYIKSEKVSELETINDLISALKILQKTHMAHKVYTNRDLTAKEKLLQMDKKAFKSYKKTLKLDKKDSGTEIERFFKKESLSGHTHIVMLYQAYEASLKGWYEEEHNPIQEQILRLDLMQELLAKDNWTFADLDKNIDSPWIMVDQDSEGWMKPNASLPLIEDPRVKKYSSLEGVEINHTTGEINFQLKEWKTSDPLYEKLFTIHDLNEMLERKISYISFSLDPADPDMRYHPFNEVYFKPHSLYQTQFLHTSLMADYILKFLTMGQEVQGRYPYQIRSIEQLIGHMPEELKNIIYDFNKAKNSKNSNSIHRFWIEAEEIPTAIGTQDKSDDIQRISLDHVRMVVKKHKMVLDKEGNLVDQDEKEEGWQHYVVTNLEEAKKLKLNLPSLIYVQNERKIYSFENDEMNLLSLSKELTDDFLSGINKFPLDKNQKVKV